MPSLHDIRSLEEFISFCLWQGVKRIAYVNKFRPCASQSFQGFLLFCGHGQWRLMSKGNVMEIDTLAPSRLFGFLHYSGELVFCKPDFNVCILGSSLPWDLLRVIIFIFFHCKCIFESWYFDIKGLPMWASEHSRMPVVSGGRSETVWHWYFLFRPPENHG